MDDRLGTASADGDSTAEDSEDSAVAASSVQKPSVAGSIVPALPQQRSRALLSRSDSGVTLPKPGKIRGKRRNGDVGTCWSSSDNLDPSSVTGRIGLGERTPDAEGAELHIRMVRADGIYLVTVSLINNARVPDSATRRDREAYMLFQTGIIIRSRAGYMAGSKTTTQDRGRHGGRPPFGREKQRPTIPERPRIRCWTCLLPQTGHHHAIPETGYRKRILLRHHGCHRHWYRTSRHRDTTNLKSSATLQTGLTCWMPGFFPKFPSNCSTKP